MTKVEIILNTNLFTMLFKTSNPNIIMIHLLSVLERLERLFGTYHQSHRTRLPLAFLRGQAAFCCYCLCLKRFYRTCLFYLLIRKLIAWRIWLEYQYSPLNSRMYLFLHSRSHYLLNYYHLLLFRFPHQHPLWVVHHLQGILKSHQLKGKKLF